MTETFHPAWDGSRASLSYGLPFTDAASKHVEHTFDASRVYILASASLANTTAELQKLQDALGPRVAGVRIGMQPHTLWSECLAVTADARAAHADLLLTLGGGSLIDAAKIVALALANNAHDFPDLLALTTSAAPSAPVNEPTVPILAIPTTLSGGEYNDRAGGTNDETKQKYSFAGPIRGPALVALDPRLTTATPEKWWLSTGVRAVDHCVEALCSLQGTAPSDGDASDGLAKLIPGLLRCQQDRSDLEARLQCQLAVVSAVKATNGAPMGASHGIGHQLGPLGVGHGETSCVLLPAVCRFNARVNAERQRRVCGMIWGEREVREVFLGSLKEEGESDLADLLDAYFRVLGMPRSLRAVGVGEDRFAELARNSLTDRHLRTNPIPITEVEQVLEILRMVENFDGK